MAFPANNNPSVTHLFVDSFKSLITTGGAQISSFFDFCKKNNISELSLYDINGVLSASTYNSQVSDFIFSSKTKSFICEVAGNVNPFDFDGINVKHIEYVLNYNNDQIDQSRKFDRITLENKFWNLETNSNPLKSSVGYTISTVGGNSIANIGGGALTPLFVVGNMVKVSSTGEYRQVLAVGINTVTFDRPFNSTTLTPSTFEIRDHFVNQGYSLDFETYFHRIKTYIRPLALQNNLKVEAYLGRTVSQSQYLRLIPYLDRILIENDYEQNNYVLYNDLSQGINNVRGVLNKCTQNRTGTVSIGTNSNIIAGTGTNFLSELGIGTKINVGDKIFTINSITNSTQAVLLEINTGTTISGSFRSHIEFLPIYFLDKTGNQNWMTNPSKGYDDVYKMFTISGFTVSGATQFGGSPICYNLETSPSITGGTSLVGISLYSRTFAQTIDDDVKIPSSPKAVCRTGTGAITPAITTLSDIDSTCENAFNGGVNISFNPPQSGNVTFQFINRNTPITIPNGPIAPYPYNLGWNETITITESFSVAQTNYTYQGLTVGDWDVIVNGTNIGIASIRETFLPTITGNYISAGNGGITLNVSGGYNNYYIALINAPTNVTNPVPTVTYVNNGLNGGFPGGGNNSFFESNLTNGTHTFNSTGPSGTQPYNFVPGTTYYFIVGDTDACIKYFAVQIPNAPAGPTLSLVSSTNPACSTVQNGSITVQASNITGAYSYTVTRNGQPIIVNPSNPLTLTNLDIGTYVITLTDTVGTSNTITVTLSYVLNSSTVSTAPTAIPNTVCFNLSSQGSPYTITGNAPFPTQTNVTSTNYCVFNVPAGSYTFQITAANGCQFNIVQPYTVTDAVITLLVNNTINPSCDEAANGYIRVTASSNSPNPFNYTATLVGTTTSYTSTNGVFTGLIAGTWEVGVTQGIVTGPTITVTLSNIFLAEVSSTGTTICVVASGGSTGYYTVEINGNLYSYNTGSTINCYTGTCSTNQVRVIDGDIINTSISGCVYSTVVNGFCQFNYFYTANTVSCNGTGDIYVSASGGTPPYNFTLIGLSNTYSRPNGIFTSLTPGIWEIIAEDSTGQSGTTFVNLDNRLNFSATTSLTGVCITISNGIGPYYLQIDDITVYTIVSPGTYCYELDCGYHGINVYDSCPDSVCANVLFTNATGNAVTFDNVYWIDCDGTNQSTNVSPRYEFQTCLILGSQTYAPGIIFEIIGFCPTTIGESCYIDNSIVVEIPCGSGGGSGGGNNQILPLGIYQTIPPSQPSCSGDTDGVIYVSGINGVPPYVSYSAISGNIIYTSNNGTIFNISQGDWTVYVRDSVGSITSTTISIGTSLNPIISFTATSIDSIVMCVNIPSNAVLIPPYILTILGNQYTITNNDVNYCINLTGITACSVNQYSICNDTSVGTTTLYNYSTIHVPTLTTQGINFYSDLTEVIGGQLYGTTYNGGAYINQGTLFTCDFSGNYNIIHNFDDVLNTALTYRGLHPQGKILLAINNFIYGTTTDGGINYSGVLYGCDQQGANYVVLHDFGGTVNGFPDGSVPREGPIEDPLNFDTFYGVTTNGGRFGKGIIYQYSLGPTLPGTGGNYQIIHYFGLALAPNNGEYPFGGLIIYNNKIYGTTTEGGTLGYGVIFSYDLIGASYLTEYSFSYIDGIKPLGTLIEVNGFLYGTTSAGGAGYGTIFKYEIGAGVLVLHTFNGGNGAYPYSSLILGTDGLLYGTTYSGGSNNFGTIYTISPTGTYRKIHDFNGLDGRNPVKGLIQASDSNFYGTTLYDDSLFSQTFKPGVIYKLTTTQIANVDLCCYVDTIDLSDYRSPSFEISGGTWLSGSPAVCVSIDLESPPYNQYLVTVDGITYNYNNSINPNCFVTSGCGLTTISVGRVGGTGCTKTVTTNLSNSRSEPNVYASIFSGSPAICIAIDTNNYFLGPYQVELNNVLYSYNTGLTANCYTLATCDYVDVLITSTSKPDCEYSTTVDISSLYPPPTIGATFLSGNPAVCISIDVNNYFDPPYVVTIDNSQYSYNTGLTANCYTILVCGDIDVTVSSTTNTGCYYRTSVNINDLLPHPNIYTSFLSGSPVVCVEIEPNLFTPPPYVVTINGIDYSYDTGFTANCYTLIDCSEIDVTVCTLVDNTRNSYRVIYNFSGNTYSNGSTPQKGLIEASSGVLYGLTFYGGSTGEGTIFTYNISSNTQTTIHEFSNIGSNPVGKLIEVSNGIFYGMTNSTTLFDYKGVIFSCNSVGNYGIVHEFGNQLVDGKTPNGSLIISNSGLLYGMTTFGGNTNRGTIFSCNTLGNYGKLFDFSGTTGYFPYGDLVEGSENVFYGMTNKGGKFNIGTIFKFNSTNRNYSTLFSFSGSNGSHPYGSLIIVNNALFGMTYSGGTNNKGIIFSCDTSGNNFTTIYNFGNFGSKPIGDLLLSSDGKLYGTTTSNELNYEGVVFSIDFSKTYQVVHTMGEGQDGSVPFSTLIEASNNRIYGATTQGGKYGYNGSGTLFELYGSYNESCCYTTTVDFYLPEFTINYVNGLPVLCLNITGQTPQSYVINVGVDEYNYISNSGNLCITADTCGTNLDLTITPVDTYNYRILHKFTGTSEDPEYSVTQLPNGLFYGVASSPNRGVIYTSNTMGETGVVFTFDGTTYGSGPFGGLLLGSDGFLYGYTDSGGAGTNGTFYKFDPSTNLMTVLHYFTTNAGPSLFNPAPVIEYNSTGRFYGVYETDGITLPDHGAIFNYSPPYSVIYQFNDNINRGGKYPRGGLMVGHDGFMYGTTSQGGIFTFGTIYKVNQNGNHTVIYNFSGGTNGENPKYELIQDPISKFIYGIANVGLYGYGLIYAINTSGESFTILHSFLGFPTDGATPSSRLLRHSNGHYYGLTSNGGQINNFDGTIYKIDINGNVASNYEVLHYFSGSTYQDGNDPEGMLIEGLDGNIYGIAKDGGISENGIIYVLEYNPGCPANYSIEIPCESLAIENITVTNAFCCTDAATIEISISGGNSPYTYTIYNLPNTATYTNNTGIFTNVTPPSGSWFAEVIDNFGNVVISDIFTLNSTFFADIIFDINNAIVSFSGADRTIVVFNGVSYVFDGSSATTVSFPLICGIDNIVTVEGSIFFNNP